MLDTATGNGTTGTGSPIDGTVREGARRGTRAPVLAVGDGAPGSRKAVSAPHPTAPAAARRGHGRPVERPEAVAA
ncbi:hypothetical protein ABZZ04_32545 [Streptomyces sp. NPDC006435]|uniref:hypothetical protein n=1 Tax=Streptomyces sp. NPDC006435 TaxID=3154300 RepID=UPI0033AD8CA0